MGEKLHPTSCKIVINAYGFSATTLSEIFYSILDSQSSLFVFPDDAIELRVERRVVTDCNVSK